MKLMVSPLSELMRPMATERSEKPITYGWSETYPDLQSKIDGRSTVRICTASGDLQLSMLSKKSSNAWFFAKCSLILCKKASSVVDFCRYKKKSTTLLENLLRKLRFAFQKCNLIEILHI